MLQVEQSCESLIKSEKIPPFTLITTDIRFLYTIATLSASSLIKSYLQAREIYSSFEIVISV